MKDIMTLLVLMSVMGVIDSKAMIKNGLKKELMLYIICFLFAGLIGILYLVNPLRPSIVSYLFNFFHVEW